MARTLTPDQLLRKLNNLEEAMLPAISKAMQNAALVVEGVAKGNCTPGKSPYYKAPYSDDNDPRRNPVHMRDCIKGEVLVLGKTVHGVVRVDDSATGEGHFYAHWVHDGTSKMRARPFILDAVKEKDKETREILSEAITAGIQKECER